MKLVAELGAILFGALKWPLMLGGPTLVVVGLVADDVPLILWGVLAFALGFAVQGIDRRRIDKRHAAWAKEAVAGIGPIPPRPVRETLARRALNGVGVMSRGDYEPVFRDLCRTWAAEQQAATVRTR